VLSVRRALIIALVGVILISIWYFCIDYQIGQYQQTGNPEQNDGTLFGGAVFLGLRHGLASFWHWVHANEAPLLVVFTFALFVVTALLVRYTKKLWRSTKDLVERTEGSTRIIERAYVKISHRTPPGLLVDLRDHTIFVRFEVKNFGKTPAEVTDIFVGPKILLKDESLPYPPTYGSGKAQRFVLAPGEPFKYTNSEAFKMDIEPEVRSGAKKLYVLGYVDYIDKFGEHHRAGYARLYSPELDDLNDSFRDNLIFVTEKGYNYDRPRKKGEGNDWDNEPTS
jgi:hypothetical protein